MRTASVKSGLEDTVRASGCRFIRKFSVVPCKGIVSQDLDKLKVIPYRCIKSAKGIGFSQSCESDECWSDPYVKIWIWIRIFVLKMSFCLIFNNLKTFLNFKFLKMFYYNMDAEEFKRIRSHPWHIFKSWRIITNLIYAIDLEVKCNILRTSKLFFQLRGHLRYCWV
jgi:hypothetical protein